MGKGTIINRYKTILKMSIPLIIQGVVFQLQSLTDKAFLGNLDTKYVSAIGAATLPFNASMDSFAAICTGLVILVSVGYGANRNEDIENYVKSTIFYNTIIGVLLFFLWQIFVFPLLAFFNVDVGIVGYGAAYIRICAVYLLFAGIDGAFQGMLQGLGKTKPIMYAGILKVSIDVFVSWVLIYGKFGFPKMNVVGAAIGSLAANIVSLCFVIIYTMSVYGKKYHLYNFSRRWFEAQIYIHVITLGLPVSIEFLLWNITNLILVRFINGFSYIDMAIYTLTFGCQCIIYVAISGVSRGMMSLIGQMRGAGRTKEVAKYFYGGIFLNLVFVAIGILVFSAIPEKVLGIFSNDGKVIQKGIPYLIGIGLITLPQSLNVACGAGIRANGNTKWMLCTQAVGSCIVVGLSYLLVYGCKLEMTAIYITLFVDETVRGTMNLIYYRRNYGIRTLKNIMGGTMNRNQEI